MLEEGNVDTMHLALPAGYSYNNHTDGVFFRVTMCLTPYWASMCSTLPAGCIIFRNSYLWSICLGWQCASPQT